MKKEIHEINEEMDPLEKERNTIQPQYESLDHKIKSLTNQSKEKQSNINKIRKDITAKEEEKTNFDSKIQKIRISEEKNYIRTSRKKNKDLKNYNNQIFPKKNLRN